MSQPPSGPQPVEGTASHPSSSHDANSGHGTNSSQPNSPHDTTEPNPLGCYACPIQQPDSSICPRGNTVTGCPFFHRSLGPHPSSAASLGLRVVPATVCVDHLIGRCANPVSDGGSGGSGSRCPVGWHPEYHEFADLERYADKCQLKQGTPASGRSSPYEVAEMPYPSPSRTPTPTGSTNGTALQTQKTRPSNFIVRIIPPYTPRAAGTAAEAEELALSSCAIFCLDCIAFCCCFLVVLFIISSIAAIIRNSLDAQLPPPQVYNITNVYNVGGQVLPGGAGGRGQGSNGSSRAGGSSGHFGHH